jgi:hypothetical protein
LRGVPDSEEATREPRPPAKIPLYGFPEKIHCAHYPNLYHRPAVPACVIGLHRRTELSSCIIVPNYPACIATLNYLPVLKYSTTMIS